MWSENYNNCKPVIKAARIHGSKYLLMPKSGILSNSQNLVYSKKGEKIIVISSNSFKNIILKELMILLVS